MFLRISLLLLVYACLLGASCTGPDTADYPPKILNEVQQLETAQQKTAFLESLHLSDQADRKKNLPSAQLLANDKVRLQKIGAYLDTYGYPSKKQVSRAAVDAPYLVIHHAPTNEPRHQYFPLIYQAVKDGDIDPETFAFFLGRFQKIENGSWIEFGRPFTVEEEIDTLLTALGLDTTTTTINP